VRLLNKMARSKTPSFMVELPLGVSDAERATLQTRLDVARQIYNACLGESLNRLRLKRQSKVFQAAQRLPKSQSAKRQAAFHSLDKAFGFQEYVLHEWVKQFTKTWLNQHIDASTAQKLASRAFKAVQDYAFGKRGKPRFKGKHQLDSVEGKSNETGLRWREHQVEWLGLVLPAIINERDEVITYSLQQPVKYVRLVRRKLNGKIRFFVQLVCKGKPYHKTDKHPLGKGKVGLDLGPSMIAGVSRQQAFLLPFCAELDPQYAELRRLKRKLDRQRRANNPANYETDGTVKVGQQQWHISNRMQHTQTKIAELHRKQATHCKSLHGQLVNFILSVGDVIQLEAINYKAWQKNYGRSIGRHAPGHFVEHLTRKAASAGAKVHKLPTQQLCLSQVCHGCGQKVKKPLSQRQHQCVCGVAAQRDLYSAFLAMCVENHTLDMDDAKAAWSGVEMLLRVASSGQNQLARVRQESSRAGDLSSATEPVAREAGTKSGEAQDAVP
jgi:putative transposase